MSDAEQREHPRLVRRQGVLGPGQDCGQTRGGVVAFQRPPPEVTQFGGETGHGKGRPDGRVTGDDAQGEREPTAQRGQLGRLGRLRVDARDTKPLGQQDTSLGVGKHVDEHVPDTAPGDQAR